jgi:hypothetical protein
MRKNIMNCAEDEEFVVRNEEICVEISVYACCTSAGGSTGSTASFESPFDLTHI